MNGIVRRVGWVKDEEGNRVFRAIVEYPNGPPIGLNWSVVWDETPVEIIVVKDAVPHGVGAPCG